MHYLKGSIISSPTKLGIARGWVGGHSKWPKSHVLKQIIKRKFALRTFLPHWCRLYSSHINENHSPILPRAGTGGPGSPHCIQYWIGAGWRSLRRKGTFAVPNHWCKPKKPHAAGKGLGGGIEYGGGILGRSHHLHSLIWACSTYLLPKNIPLHPPLTPAVHEAAPLCSGGHSLRFSTSRTTQAFPLVLLTLQLSKTTLQHLQLPALPVAIILVLQMDKIVPSVSLLYKIFVYCSMQEIPHHRTYLYILILRKGKIIVHTSWISLSLEL